MEFLKEYERYLLDQGKFISTVGIYLRPLRPIVNEAIAEGFISKEFYPFGKRRYQIPASRNVKKALSLQEMGKIYHYQPLIGTWWEKAVTFFYLAISQMV